MSFADPQSITINAVAYPLPRTASGVNTGTFTHADGTVKLSVNHAYGKRTRRTFRLDHTKIAPDPLISAVNVSRSLSVGFWTDTPIDGYTLAEIKQIQDGFLAFLTASSGAKLTQLNGGEN